MHNLSSPTIARRIINNSFSLLILLFLLSMLSSFYHKVGKKNDAMVQLSEHQIDSLSFFSEHHYTNNYNFVVKQDSVVLYSQQPEEILSTGMEVDSFPAYKHDMLAVAEIRIIPTDSIDSVWVELATEDSRFGWTRESQFLNRWCPTIQSRSSSPYSPMSTSSSSLCDRHYSDILLDTPSAQA